MFDWHPINNRDGALIPGRVSGDMFVWEADTLRYADSLEIYLGRACIEDIENEKDSLGQHSSYTCQSHMWSFDSVNVITDPRDGRTYKTIKIGDQYWMAENLNFEYKVDGFAYGNRCDVEEYQYGDYFGGSLLNSEDCSQLGRFYTWAAAMDSAAVYSRDGWGCGNGKKCSQRPPIRGVCPEGWHLPDSTEWKKLYAAVGESPQAMLVLGSDKWTDATDAFGFAARATMFDNYSSSYSYYTLFWASTEVGPKRLCVDGRTCADLFYLSDEKVEFGQQYVYKENFSSVRCVKNE